MTDQLDLDAIEALCEAATEGEWMWVNFPRDGIGLQAELSAFGSGDCVGRGVLFHHAAWPVSVGDRQLIEQAPVLIPALVARVRADEERIKELVAVIQSRWECVDKWSQTQEAICIVLNRHPEKLPCGPDEYSWDDLPDMIAYVLGENPL